ncbi:seminal metalloprotease 1 [Drosophila eugracilis]|uniref:seminal metalloprotease 1 n=1 Tax=Drosophila eugracilis TaxID=29029 RepID=UPI001BD98FD1|nr:seminal metalloprotease 1 [Drosophila eugracilis]
MYSLTCTLLLLFARQVFNKPLEDPELRQDYYQGDILYQPVRTRNGIVNKILHWPNGTVPYIIEKNAFDDSHHREILRAISIIEENSCVVFAPVTEEEHSNAVVIRSNGFGCNSAYLGYRQIQQIVNLQIFPIGMGCFRIGSIIHELLHILGFEHQHVANNRDEYISIQWDNIQPKFNINFVNTDNSTLWHDFGEGYDYESVMHYVPKAFSKNGQPTIIPLRDGAENMGQRLYMSEKDIRKLNKMYNCPGYV